MYQDLSTSYDWPVKKTHCRSANQDERKFETLFRFSLSSLRVQNKDIGTASQMLLSLNYVCDCHAGYLCHWLKKIFLKYCLVCENLKPRFSLFQTRPSTMGRRAFVFWTITAKGPETRVWPQKRRCTTHLLSANSLYTNTSRLFADWSQWWSGSWPFSKLWVGSGNYSQISQPVMG